MSCAACLAYDVAERAALRGRPGGGHAPGTCTCGGTSYGWTWAPSRDRPRDGLRLTMTGDELRAALADPASHEGGKESLPFVCPATFRRDHRAAANVEAVHMLGLDIDEPTATPGKLAEQIAEALGHVEVFACSTYSSEPGAYRLRAFVPYDVPASADEHRASWSFVAHVLGGAGVGIDRACKDPSRGYYVWAVPPNGVYWHAHVDGAAWPVARAARLHGAQEAAREAARARDAAERRARLASPARAGGRTLPPFDRARRYVATMDPSVSGAGGHAALWRVARALVADFALDDADALELLREFSARCMPPWSESELRHKLRDARKARVTRDMDRRSA